MKSLSRPVDGQPSELIVDGFDDFFAREYRGVLALALALTGDRAQAEDLAQESFLAAYAVWDRIDEPATWTRTVVANKAMSWWRRQYAQRRALSRIGHREESTATDDDTDWFWAEVRRLPGRQAQAVTLFYLEDRPVADIARLLGCSESTARTHLSRGRETLGTRLGVDR